MLLFKQTVSVELTTANGMIHAKNQSDTSNPGLLLHTTSNTTSIGMCCGSDYGGYGTNNAWIRYYGGGDGQIRCQYNNGGLFMSINATSWTAASDERLQTVHGIYHNPLESVKQLRPIKFTRKDDDSYKCVGVVAQSVQNAVPESVEK